MPRPSPTNPWDRPVVDHHLYGGPMSGTVMSFSGAPNVLRCPIPGTAYQPEVGRSQLLEMATYIRMAIPTPTSPSATRYVHEDLARYWQGRSR